MALFIQQFFLIHSSSHLETNEMREPLQSEYRPKHSTETALLKILNDLLLVVDSKHCVTLLLLDMSAAFDTVNHNILLHRLENSFGITGSVNTWLRSYFTERYQCVNIGGCSSTPIKMDTGMPQGSILGPKGYPSYVSPLFEIVRKHSVNIHMYADDTQLYLGFNLSQYEAAKLQMERCIAGIRSWLSANCLKLNDDKTELLFIGQKHSLSKLPTASLNIGSTTVKSCTSAKNIGAVIDSELKMVEHVNHISKACYLGLRSLSKLRPYLNEETAAILVHSFITCRLDSLNGVLIGEPKYCLNRLQNNAARIVPQI